MGTGSYWGAQKLNDLFKQLVKHLLGDQFNAVLERVGGPDAPADLILEPLARGFEKAKRGFSTASTDDIKIRFDSDQALPKIPGLPLGPKWITLTAAQMACIFDEYIPHVRKLVDDQLQEIRRNSLAKDEAVGVEIVAVGGGSLSPYIIDKLQEAYPENKVSGQEQTK